MGHSDKRLLRQPSRRLTAVGAVTIMLAVALFAAVAASAHVPTLETGNVPGEGAPISGPDVSRAIYGYLEAGKEFDAYTFIVSAPLERQIGILVPAYSEHADFRPSIVLSTQGAPPIEIADSGRADRMEEWEPFSLTTFWKGAETTAAFESGRQYIIRVKPGVGTRSGRYVIVFGGPERFTTPDTLGTLRDLPAIWFGAYGGAPFRWNWWALIPVSILAAIVAGVVRLAHTGLRRAATVRRGT